MLCFEPTKQDVAVTVNTPAGKIELKMLPVAQLLAIATAPKVETAPALTPRSAELAKKGTASAAVEMPKPHSEADSNDGFLVNGSTSNAGHLQVRARPGLRQHPAAAKVFITPVSASTSIIPSSMPARTRLPARTPPKRRTTG